APRLRPPRRGISQTQNPDNELAGTVKIPKITKIHPPTLQKSHYKKGLFRLFATEYFTIGIHSLFLGIWI
ncbi:MAG: hypothetical protein PHW76_10230, partial [Alphaproteobacteria bacterium]|nr:hypothetical protein [Alphaproteobacteria bacterium]